MAAALTLCAVPAAAVEIDELRVWHEQGRYLIDMQFRLQAALPDVMSVLTDYTHLTRLNPALVSAEVQKGAADGATRVRTRAQGCVLFLCVDIVRVEDVSLVADGAGIEAHMVRHTGDFYDGYTRCTFEKDVGGGLKAHYTSELDPAFFIPPLIGPPLMERGLRQGLKRTVRRLEKLAQQHGTP